MSRKLLILAILFLATAVVAHGRSAPEPVTSKPSIQAYFQELPGYRAVRNIELNEEAVRMLKLDDYAFIDFEGPEGSVNLFIGYYYTGDKAYASHSPLVCYPSQGWQVDSRPVRRTLAVGPHTVSYEEIVTSYGEQKELVLYWYQSHGRTSTQVYRNKIDMAINRLRGNDDQHAFVRVSVPLRGEEPAGNAGEEFTRGLFPELVGFFSGN